MIELTGDPEEDHFNEDQALWEFVREVAVMTWNHDDLKGVAGAMVKWDEENDDRRRWYA